MGGVVAVAGVGVVIVIIGEAAAEVVVVGIGGRREGPPPHHHPHRGLGADDGTLLLHLTAATPAVVAVVV